MSPAASAPFPGFPGACEATDKPARSTAVAFNVLADNGCWIETRFPVICKTAQRSGWSAQTLRPNGGLGFYFLSFPFLDRTSSRLVAEYWASPPPSATPDGRAGKSIQASGREDASEFEFRHEKQGNRKSGVLEEFVLVMFRQSLENAEASRSIRQGSGRPCLLITGRNARFGMWRTTRARKTG